jgi:anti-sigma B factor antagonist
MLGPGLLPTKAPLVTREQSVTVITLGPEHEHLDDAELQNLKGVLLNTAVEADFPLVVLDLSRLGYFGSSFIEALICVWKHLNARPGGRMSLCGLTANCREVVGITHLDQLWSVFETREEAVRSLRKA